MAHTKSSKIVVMGDVSVGKPVFLCSTLKVHLTNLTNLQSEPHFI